MAAVALATANRVRVVESIAQLTGYTGAAVTAGQPLSLNAAGKYITSLADAAANAKAVGVADYSRNAANLEVTVIRIGRMDGWVLDAIAYGDPVYLATAGGLDTAAGTVSLIVGKVVPVYSQTFGTAPDKVLYITIV